MIIHGVTRNKMRYDIRYIQSPNESGDHQPRNLQLSRGIRAKTAVDARCYLPESTFGKMHLCRIAGAHSMDASVSGCLYVPHDAGLMLMYMVGDTAAAAQYACMDERPGMIATKRSPKQSAITTHTFTVNITNYKAA